MSIVTCWSHDYFDNAGSYIMEVGFGACLYNFWMLSRKLEMKIVGQTDNNIDTQYEFIYSLTH